jgi:DNA-binding beta-propeller fold protein YncE
MGWEKDCNQPAKNGCLVRLNSMLRLLLPLIVVPLAFAETPTRAPSAQQLPGNGTLFNGWKLSPAGKHVTLPGDMPLKMILSPDGQAAIAVCAGYNSPGLVVLNVAEQKQTQFIPIPHIWNGLTFDREGKKLFVSGGASGEVHVFGYEAGVLSALNSVKVAPEGGPKFVAGIAVHPEDGRLYVCNEASHELWVLNAETLALEATLPAGLHPHSCLFGADKRHLYVSNWGSRSVSIVDSHSGRELRELSVGVRPNDMAIAPDGRLFVACSGDNTVHVVQTRALEKKGEDADSSRRLWDGTREIISTSLYPQSPEGSTPDALAVSPDGRTLFVANADNNCVMVVNIGDSQNEPGEKYAEKISTVEGFIPVGWYPTSLAVSGDGGTLLVGNGKGIITTPDPSRDGELKPGEKLKAIHPGRTLDGSVSFIAKPDDKQMTEYTAQVRNNSPYTPEMLRAANKPNECVIPDKVGASCPIKYVLYIIKENRTYDQVLGDMKDAKGKPIGNGDPSITLYGEDVTPNQHQLSRDYVLLDNLYCNGEVSVDGHSWCDAAMATDWNQRSWTQSYSSRKDKLPGNDELETPTAGYLWDQCKRAGISFKTYGEGAQRVPSVNRGKWGEPRDMDKCENWIKDLHEAEKTGELPRFTIMALGENHTKGTTPGAYTPAACVGSNDVAFGKIVEAATKSKFWKQMAIFVIEDDAQNGPDHVDAHRTIGSVISPWVKQKSIDHTLYTTASMIRTMELILGLPPMTQYDAGATPMFRCFTNEAVAREYKVLQPKVDLLAKNTPASPGAKASAMMDFDEYDEAPEDELNRILWTEAKGPDAPYPAPIHRVLFTE